MGARAEGEREEDGRLRHGPRKNLTRRRCDPDKWCKAQLGIGKDLDVRETSGRETILLFWWGGGGGPGNRDWGDSGASSEILSEGRNFISGQERKGFGGRVRSEELSCWGRWLPKWKKTST